MLKRGAGQVANQGSIVGYMFFPGVLGTPALAPARGVGCSGSMKRALIFGLLLATFAPAAQASAATIRAHPTRSTVLLGGSSDIVGDLHDVGAGSAGMPLELHVSAYPYSRVSVVQGLTGSDGSFDFRVKPDRRTRYRVVSRGPSPGSSGLVGVIVRARIRTSARALPLGRVQLSANFRHPADLRWAHRRATWELAPLGRSRLRVVAHTRSIDVARGLTRVTVTLAVPAGRSVYQACFRAPGERALVTARARCGGVAVTGRFRAPAGFPSPARVSHAARFMAHRRGRTAFAVIDSQGRLSGVHVHWRFVSASVVKAMLLTTSLRKLSSHRRLDGGSRSILYPMIHVSDNNAATAVWRRVGDGALRRLARRAGMTDFSISGLWTHAQISAADQARFFFEMDSLIPRQFRSYARYLLSHISGGQSWGIPSVGRPRYAVFFKGGWRGTVLGQLVHQIARFERGPLRFSLAVMTDGDPSMGYGIATIRGVAARLL